MSKDFLGEYGPESTSGSRTSSGGKQDPKPLSYDMPKGPQNQFSGGPGLKGGITHPQSQLKIARETGAPGLSPTKNYGCCGSQGKH